MTHRVTIMSLPVNFWNEYILILFFVVQYICFWFWLFIYEHNSNPALFLSRKKKKRKKNSKPVTQFSVPTQHIIIVNHHTPPISLCLTLCLLLLLTLFPIIKKTSTFSFLGEFKSEAMVWSDWERERERERERENEWKIRQQWWVFGERV